MFAQLRTARLAVFATAAMLLALATTAANGDTICVCWDGSGDYLTIQEGIDAAQDGDEVIVCDGTYAGDGNRDLDFWGKAITVHSENGPEGCVIDCEHDGRGFYFHTDETSASVVGGFTIANGYGSIYGSDGGAVYCSGSSPTISDCVIIGNQGHSGAGIYLRHADATVIDSTVRGNTADYGGGGIECYAGKPMIVGCTIAENTAAFGGGIDCWNSSAKIVGCTITDNTVPGDGFAGGVCCVGPSSARIIGCTIARNTAESGGGLYCVSGVIAMVTNCTISQNTAVEAAGVTFFDTCVATVANCTISGNSASDVGGAFYVRGNSGPRIANCTITANSALDGQAVYCSPIGSANHIEVANCVLWNGGNEVSDTGDSTVMVLYSDVAGGWLGAGNIDADPLFVDPDGPDDDPNTWEDNDYHLSGGSPCIDAGCNWGVPPDTADLDEDGDTTEFTPLDLDGEGRFFDDPNTPDTGRTCPPIVDMGAYEFGDTGPQPCPGDLDCDRTVRQSDLGILLAAWQLSNQGDLNCDGVTDESDLGILLAHWGESCP